MRKQLKGETVWGSGGSALREVLEAVFRHKLLIAVFFLSVVGVALWVLLSAPKTYTSMAKILVQRGRETSRLDPTATTSELAPVNKEWETEINSEVAILHSEDLMIQTIQTIGIDRFLDPLASPADASSDGVLQKLAGKIEAFLARMTFRTGDKPEKALLKEQAGKMASAMEMMMRNISIASQPRSDVIVVYFTSLDPYMAREVIDTMLRLYQAKRQRIHSTQAARKFFVEQTTNLLRQLNETDAQIRSLLNELGVVSLGNGLNHLEGRLSALQSHQFTLEASRSASEARLARLSEMINAVDSASAPKGGLVRGDYKDVQTALRLEETTQAALTAELQAVEQQIGAVQASIARLSRQEAPLRELERQRDFLSAQYNKYANNLEQTRIDEALDEERISNIKTIQAASLPTQSNPSKKKIKLLLAMFMGLFGGLALALGLERGSARLRRPEEAEARLQLPPLATLPAVSEDQLSPLRLYGHHHADSHALARRGTRRADEQSEDLDVLFARLVRRIQGVRSLQSASPLILGVTSCGGGEGVTSVASHLAASFLMTNAQSKVLYLDANRHPHSAGHADWLAEARGGLEVQYNGDGRLAFHPRHLEGKGEDNGKPGAALERISHDRLTPLLRRGAAQGFDVMVVDIPPLNDGDDAEQIASLMNAVILVIEAERVRWQTVQWAKNLLADTGTHLLGMVLNKQRHYVPSWIERRL